MSGPIDKPQGIPCTANSWKAAAQYIVAEKCPQLEGQEETKAVKEYAKVLQKRHPGKSKPSKIPKVFLATIRYSGLLCENVYKGKAIIAFNAPNPDCAGQPITVWEDKIVYKEADCPKDGSDNVANKPAEPTPQKPTPAEPTAKPKPVARPRPKAAPKPRPRPAIRPKPKTIPDPITEATKTKIKTIYGQVKSVVQSMLRSTDKDRQTLGKKIEKKFQQALKAKSESQANKFFGQAQTLLRKAMTGSN